MLIKQTNDYDYKPNFYNLVGSIKQTCNYNHILDFQSSVSAIALKS